jgi:pyruvate/2-oxoglutarate dehydrogenase complex dihydrolipoamide acyltransferase (E2) component
MTIQRDDILDGLGAAVTRGIKFTALADAIGARKGDYAHMRELLGALVEEGVVRQLPGGAYALAPHGRGVDKKARAALPWREPAAPAAAPPAPDAAAPPPSTTTRTRRSTRAPAAPPAAPARPARARPSAPPPTVDDAPTGRITVHPAGYGFVG